MTTLPFMESVGDETNGDRMAAARDRAGLTQEELGAKLRPAQSKQMISLRENNQVKIRPGLALQLAEVLGGSARDYVDAEYAGALELAGAADRGREWLDERKPAAHKAPPNISAAQLRDVVVSLVRSYTHDDAIAEQVAKLDFSKPAADLKILLQEEDGDLSFHLTRYLLTAAAAASSILPDDPRYDFEHWLESAERAGVLLLALAGHGKSDGPRRSG